jgi:hypothetical protein
MVYSPGAIARSSGSIPGAALVVYHRAAPITTTAVVLGVFKPAISGLPPGPVVSQRIAHFRVQEAKEQGHQETLNQK